MKLYSIPSISTVRVSLKHQTGGSKTKMSQLFLKFWTLSSGSVMFEPSEKIKRNKKHVKLMSEIIFK